MDIITIPDDSNPSAHVGHTLEDARTGTFCRTCQVFMPDPTPDTGQAAPDFTDPLDLRRIREVTRSTPTKGWGSSVDMTADRDSTTPARLTALYARMDAITDEVMRAKLDHVDRAFMLASTWDEIRRLTREGN